MGFNFLFDKIEPTGFGLNSMALPSSVGMHAYWNLILMFDKIEPTVFHV